MKGEIGRLKKDLAENEKIMKALQSGNGSLAECSRCKIMLDGIENEDGVHDDDEMLISFDNGEDPSHSDSIAETTLNQSLKKKLRVHQRQELQTVRARVVHLESLLSANLDNLSG